MIVEHDPRRRDRFEQAAPDYGVHRAGSGLRRFIGGSPTGVFLRLLFLSVLVGAFMAMLGLTPARLFWHAYDTVRALVDLGLATFHEFGGWVLAGAVVVVPLWFLSRLFATTR
ncbi:DUF6460 domain-containing protein [Methylobacterium sp. A54F]